MAAMINAYFIAQDSTLGLWYFTCADSAVIAFVISFTEGA